MSSSQNTHTEHSSELSQIAQKIKKHTDQSEVMSDSDYKAVLSRYNQLKTEHTIAVANVGKGSHEQGKETVQAWSTISSFEQNTGA